MFKSKNLKTPTQLLTVHISKTPPAVYQPQNVLQKERSSGKEHHHHYHPFYSSVFGTFINPLIPHSPYWHSLLDTKLVKDEIEVNGHIFNSTSKVWTKTTRMSNAHKLFFFFKDKMPNLKQSMVIVSVKINCWMYSQIRSPVHCL